MLLLLLGGGRDRDWCGRVSRAVQCTRRYRHVTELIAWKLVAFGELLIAATLAVLYVFTKLHAEAAERREKSAIDAMRDERTLRMDAEKREVDSLIASGRREREIHRMAFGMGSSERRRENINADVVSQLLCGERVMPPREEGEA